MGPAYAAFRAHLGRISDLETAQLVLHWDQQTYMPPGAGPGRAAQLGTLGRLAHERIISGEFGESLAAAQAEVDGADPDSDEARLLWWAGRVVERRRKVPAEWVHEFAQATSVSAHAWQQAKAESDFARFQPHLETVVRLQRAFSEFFAPYGHVYDPHLDRFEPMMTTAEVQQAFARLRPRQLQLLAALEGSAQVDDRMLHQPFDPARQQQFADQLVQALQFDLRRGRYDTSAHPFTTQFSLGDVRFTIKVEPEDPRQLIFATLHELGHALHAQGVSPSLDRTLLSGFNLFALAESQSRTIENLVGRSWAFWQGFFPKLQRLFPGQLGGVRLADFYRAVNRVQPSLIRVRADEATYNLHIMLRFELELALLDGGLRVADLPDAWRERMRLDLGLVPPDDASGVLQDVHWSWGYFGNFPTYALGNLIASQLWERMQADLPQLDQHLARADFEPLLTWLRQHVHRHGNKLPTTELLRRVTGAGLTAEPYLRYLEDKISQIYGLNGT